MRLTFNEYFSEKRGGGSRYMRPIQQRNFNKNFAVKDVVGSVHNAWDPLRDKSHVLECY